MADLTGQILGERYRVDHFLGRGGMADVYRVWDLQRAVPLACKVLRPELAQDAVFLERFEREARTLEILQHPNIVRFFGLEEAGERAFILMNFIDGLTLRKEVLLTRGGMRPERILEVMRPVCAALFYAHRMGMVHCDIKPANIMVHRNGTVYLTDFGIARMTEASVAAEYGAGTPAYMAPEQLKGHEPTPAVDIYALGVVLYEMLTGGQRPFTGKSALTTGSITKKIIWEKHNLPPPSPRKINPSVSREMEAVVLRCLSQDPALRFSDSLALLEALEGAALGDEDSGELQTLTGTALEMEPGAALDSLSLEEIAEPGGLRSKLSSVFGRLGGRRAWLAALAGGLVLALVGLALFANNARAPALPQTPAGEAPAASADAAASTDANAGSPSAHAAIPEDATRGVRTTTTRPAASPAFVAGSALIETPAAPTAPASPQPSPAPTPLGGGQWIAIASDRGGSLQIWLINPRDPLNNHQVTSLPGGACQPAWSPDGTRLAFTTPCKGPSIYHIGGTIQIVDLESGKITSLKLPRNSFDPHWSPDGQTIVYTALVASKAEVHAVNVKTGKVSPLATRGSKDVQPAYAWNGERIAFITSDTLKNDMLWMMDAGGESLEVVSESALFADPAFSPDNRLILATINRGSSSPYLALIDPFDHTRGETPLLPDTSYAQQHGSFSPDGNWILFWSEMEPGGKGEILLVDRDGKNIQRLTNNTSRDFHPAWSPQ